MPLKGCNQKSKRIYACDLEYSLSIQKKKLRTHVLTQRANGPSSIPNGWAGEYESCSKRGLGGDRGVKAAQTSPVAPVDRYFLASLPLALGG